MTQKPVVSVITITFNAAQTLEKTIRSVASQSYPHVEYIIIDGASTDTTTDIIKKNNEHISLWQSEPDKGLYDAMNKGLNKATGDYVWFINSGDEIMEKDTLSSIFESTPYADIYYGDTVMTNMAGDIIGGRRLTPPEQLTWKSFKKGMLVSHQSIIVSRKIAQPYNLKYRFSADFEWCLTALMRAERIKNTHLTLSRFLDGGITKQNIVAGLKERFRIMAQYFGVVTTIAMHIPIGIKFLYFVVRNKRF